MSENWNSELWEKRRYLIDTCNKELSTAYNCSLAWHENRIRLKKKGISRRWEMTLVRDHRRGNPQTRETAQGVVNNSKERRGTSVLMASSRSNASNKLPASILYKRTYCNVRKLKIDRQASPRLPFSPAVLPSRTSHAPLNSLANFQHPRTIKRHTEKK